jgi:hypothetical protein
VASNLKRNLKVQRQELEAERQSLRAEWDLLTAARVAFESTQQEVHSERETLARWRLELETQQQALNSERQAVAEVTPALQNDRDIHEAAQYANTVQEEVLESERHSLKNKEEVLKADREALDSERQSTAADGSRLTEERGAVAVEAQRLAADRHALAANLQTVHVQRQTVSAERRIVESQRQSLEVQQQRLAADQQDLEAARQQLGLDRHLLESWQAQMMAEAAQGSQRITEQVSAFVAAREAFDRQCDAWQPERERLQARLRDELDRCQRQAAQLSQIRQDLNRGRTDWEDHRRRTEADLEARRQVLDRRAAESVTHARQLEEQQAAIAVREAALASSQTPPVEAAAANAPGWFGRLPDSGVADSPLDRYWPVGSGDFDTQTLDSCVGQATESLAGVTGWMAELNSSPQISPNDEHLFGRLRAFAAIKPKAAEESLEPGNWPTEEDCQNDDHGESPADRLTKADRIDSEKFVPSTIARVHDDQESIDDYMDRLLDRIRRSRKEEKRPAVAVESRPTVAETHVQLVAQSAPPKLGIDLRAMRDLANVTARRAIDRHDRRLRTDVFGKIASGVVSIGCGALLMLQRTPIGSRPHAVGLVAIAVGIHWIYKAASSGYNARNVKSRTTNIAQAESHATIHDVPEAASHDETPSTSNEAHSAFE